MHQAIEFSIQGLSPLICHNGQLADPINPYSKRMKAITSKRKKTDQDFQDLYNLEWEGSLYLNADRRPVMPGENLEAAMVQGAKKQRLGDAAKAGLLCDGLWPIKFKGPQDIEVLRNDPNFRDIRKVKIQKNSVMRCRPIFVSWSLDFTLHFLPDLLNKSQVSEILATVGRIVGIGDFKPKYGRFLIL